MAGTIQQIAEMAGVSRGTVDRALNHRGRVNRDVARHIEQIADDIGYVTMSEKKEMASTVSGVEKTIGVVTRLIRSPFMSPVREGIEDARSDLSRQGFKVIIREITDVDEEEQARVIDELAGEDIDALAIMPVESEAVRQSINRLIAERDIPVFTFNSDIVGTERMCFVGLDNRKSGCVAAGLMGLMTHSRGQVIGVTGDFSNSVGIQRIDGFVETLKNDFPEMEMVGVQCSHDSAEEVEQIILNAMAIYPGLNGIFLASGGQDGVRQAFKKLELETRPYVIVYDLTQENIGLLKDGTADFLIDQEGYWQGYTAVSMLADKLRWNKDPEQEYVYSEINIKTKYSS